MRYGPRRVSGITAFIVALGFVSVAFTFSVHAQHRTTTSTTPVSVEQAPMTADATLETALVRAKEEGKLIFVHFSTPTCGWCHFKLVFSPLSVNSPPGSPASVAVFS